MDFSQELFTKESVGFVLEVATVYESNSIWWGKLDMNGCAQFCPVAALMIYHGAEFRLALGGGIISLPYHKDYDLSLWWAALDALSKRLGYRLTDEYLANLQSGEVRERLEKLYESL